MFNDSSVASGYLDLASQCRSENQLNRLHIQLEVILTPREMRSLADLPPLHPLSVLSGRWLEKIENFSPGILTSPQQFNRRVLAKNVMLYQDPEVGPSRKSLLVGFTGNGRRLGLPISVLLQCLDSRAWDVVLLFKGRDKRSYLTGIRGVSRRLAGVVRYVRKSTQADRYRRIVTFGTSAGGFAAALAANFLHAARGVSICGFKRHARLSLGVRCRLKVHEVLGIPRPALELVYGEDRIDDYEGALAVQKLLGGRLRPIPGVNDHNLLGAMLKRGQLAEFLGEILA
jgi:hypothetical protein